MEQNKMPILESSNIFASPYFLSFAKIAILIILVIYDIFALVIIKQINLMGNTLIVPTSKLLNTVAIGHVLFAIAMTVLVWVIL